MRDRMKSRTASAVVAVIATLGLASCAVGTGGAKDTGATYAPDAKLSGNLTVMGFSGVDEVATSRMDLAKKDMSGVKVTLIEGDLDIQQFLSSVASGKPPEVLYASRDQIGSLAARGAIIPLDKCIAGEGIDTGQFVKSALSQVTLDGQVYGIPEFNSVQLTMANADLLSAAGLTLDDVNGSDWKAVSAANKALTKGGASNLSVIGYDSKLPEFMPLWAKANGVDLISTDGKKAQLDDPKVVEALKWAVSIYNDQGGFSAVKAFRDSADFFGAGNQFASGTLGAMPFEQWYVNMSQRRLAGCADGVRHRARPHGKTLAYATGSAWAIPSGSANPEAACRWARVMTSVDAWDVAAKARIKARDADGKPFTGILTGNADADAKVHDMVTSGGEPWDTAVAKMYEANDSTFSLPANPADAEFKSALQDAVNSVLNGQASAEDALKKAQSQAQSALDKAWADLQKKKK